MRKHLRQLRMRFVEAWRSRDDTGASVAEIALIASGLVVLSIGVMAAIKALVDNQIPLIGN
jgi:Flp pilus assembly pilin Flp